MCLVISYLRGLGRRQGHPPGCVATLGRIRGRGPLAGRSRSGRARQWEGRSGARSAERSNPGGCPCSMPIFTSPSTETDPMVHGPLIFPTPCTKTPSLVLGRLRITKKKAPGPKSRGIFGGTKRNRTAVAGFADLCLTTRP